MSALWIPVYIAYLLVGIIGFGWIIYKTIDGPIAGLIHLLVGFLWIALPVLIFFGVQK